MSELTFEADMQSNVNVIASHMFQVRRLLDYLYDYIYCSWLMWTKNSDIVLELRHVAFAILRFYYSWCITLV